ncbi:MAG TPA: helix-turn-helix domain-containing protein [Firmicutes bacterium]|nr:helix-turn-helix domain-containing protein [Bacillota bacterium]
MAARLSGLPPALTVEQAAEVLHVSRNTCYELIRRNAIPHRHIGRRIVVPAWRLLEWLGDAEASRDHLLGIHFSANDHARAQTGRQVVPIRRKCARA